MKERAKIGFIGFGEVAQTLSKRMKEMGGDIFCHDKFPEKIKKRAEDLNITLLGNMEELIRSSSILLSTIWPDAALDVAKEASTLLSKDQIYCDMNSISPETTEEMFRVIKSRGGNFVKIGIMAAIPDRGYQVPMLAGGERAKDVEEILSRLGLNIKAISIDPKHPAAMKILRSVCLKGIVALAYEMLRGAEKYGIMDEILESASEVMSKSSFKDTINNWLTNSTIHARRRAKEMDEAIETLKNAGIDPVMSLGTKRIFEEIADLRLDEFFKGEAPKTFHEVLKKVKEFKSIISEKK